MGNVTIWVLQKGDNGKWEVVECEDVKKGDLMGVRDTRRKWDAKGFETTLLTPGSDAFMGRYGQV